jgi:hypothetical protein
MRNLEMSFETQLLQYIIAGLTLGSMYAIVAMGYSMVYNATKVINFAQGEFVMLGGLITIFLHSKLHIALIPCIILTTLLVTFIGILIERFTIGPANVGGHDWGFRIFEGWGDAFVGQGPFGPSRFFRRKANCLFEGHIQSPNHMGRWNHSVGGHHHKILLKSYPLGQGHEGIFR